MVSIEKLVRGAEQVEGGMKTWRESLIPDDNAIRINRRSVGRPRLVGFDLSKGLFDKSIENGNKKIAVIIRFEEIFSRLLLTLSVADFRL